MIITNSGRQFHLSLEKHMRLTSKFFFLLTLLLTISSVRSQNSQHDYQETANKIFDTALQEGQAYEMLKELCLDVGPRLSGSPEAAAAVEWGRQTMEKAGLTNVHLQALTVPHWVRGSVEEATILNSISVGSVPLTVCALGGSISTPTLGITAKIIEVNNFDQVRELGEKARGSIIFYNRPLDKTKRKTFSAYSGAVDQRSRGAIEAAKVGAVAVLVRSMTTREDDVPHTGAMNYTAGVPQIPAAAISTVDANFLSALVKKDSTVNVNLKLNCQSLPDAPSANVIGEITGTELPDEVVLLGGHLDSWDKGHGAHDDGAGCVQSIEAIRLLQSMGLKPKRTIRAVLFMNEENGLRGGKDYAQRVAANGPKHIAAIESDRGGFTPRGISIQAEPTTAAFKKVMGWAPLLSAINADHFESGGSGADISSLKKNGTLTMGLLVDSHRYFDYHHSDNDTFDKVNERELQLGAAGMAIIAYVLANEGLPAPEHN